jgi:ATP-dependent Lhr-like helicase
MHSEDLLAVVFPDQLACLENIQGDREIPDHPLVNQTIEDCLNEAMEIDQLERLLDRIQSGQVELVAKDLTEASPLAHEIINARPYAFLDDAPLEERRTQAVRSRRWIDPAEAKNLGKLDEGAIEAVRAEAWPEPRDLDELHDALVLLGYVTVEEVRENKWEASLMDLAKDGRATFMALSQPPVMASPDLSRDEASPTLFWRAIPNVSGSNHEIASVVPSTSGFPRNDMAVWVAAERLPYLQSVFPGGIAEPALQLPDRIMEQTKTLTREKALVELIRCRLSGLGPVWQSRFADELGLEPTDVEVALTTLENEGYVFRGQFTSHDHAMANDAKRSEAIPGNDKADTEWCERRLLARIHRYTLESLRKEVQPVTSADFMRFLFSWQGITGEKLEGPEALQKVLLQLEGYEAQAAAWEADILSARLKDYSHEWLDQLCWSGRIMWGRLRPNGSGSTPIKTTPISLFTRHRLEFWLSLAANGKHTPSGYALQVFDLLKKKGASFFDEILVETRLLPLQVEEALAALVGIGLVTSDSYTGLRALLVAGKYRTERRSRKNAFTMDMAGRWTLLPLASNRDSEVVSLSPSTSSGQALSKTASVVIASPDVDRGEASPNYNPPDNGIASVVPIASGLPRNDSFTRSSTVTQEQLLTIAKILLNRYGVMFRKLADRDAMAPPWRDLVRAYRLLEARGEIRGGRFVEGFYGEQYALPEAIPLLRKHRSLTPTLSPGEGGTRPILERAVRSEALVSLSAADPLNLVGIITPDNKVTAHYKNRILFKDGKLVASKEGDDITFHVKPADETEAWHWKSALVQRNISPRLRAYLGKGIAK